MTTTTLATLLLVLLLLVFELLLKLFDLVNGIVILLVAARAPTLAAFAAGLGGPAGVVDPALVGEVRIFVVRLPLLTVCALLLFVLDLARLLLLVREAGLLPGNLANLQDVAGAARDLLVLIKQIAIGHHGIRAPLEEACELIQLAGKGSAVRVVVLRQHVLHLGC